jgi:predicted GNAT superfamily acetyltransferase
VFPTGGWTGYPEAGYRELLERAGCFYVASHDGEVVGFVVAYGRERVRSDEWLNLEMTAFFPDFVVVEQIATAPDKGNLGVGTALFHRVLERSTEIPVIAAVVAEPPNRPSTALHQKLGFRPMTVLTPPDGMPRTVRVTEPDIARVLEEQLRLATDLCKHEDLLTWQKLDNYSYVSVGLIALLGFTLSDVPDGTRGLILLLGVPAISRQGARRLHRSPSSWVLQVLPALAACGWWA